MPIILVLSLARLPMCRLYLSLMWLNTVTVIPMHASTTSNSNGCPRNTSCSAHRVPTRVHTRRAPDRGHRSRTATSASRRRQRRRRCLRSTGMPRRRHIICQVLTTLRTLGACLFIYLSCFLFIYFFFFLMKFCFSMMALSHLYPDRILIRRVSKHRMRSLTSSKVYF